MSGQWDKDHREQVTANLRAWRKRNPEKVKEQQVAAKPSQARWHKQKNYSLSRLDFENLLLRQQHKCCGCSATLDGGRRTHVDHDHKTGRVRGLLCGHCNAGLGFLKDSAATMYQLSAYLELDRSKSVIYLVGSLRNPAITDIGNKLRDSGFEVVDNWMAAGPIADDSWQEYSNKRGRSYVEALQSREARHVFHFDKAYLNLSDIIVLAYPAGKSAHMEFGYALGRGKQGYILVDTEQERYDVMLQFANQGVFLSIDDLIKELKLKST